MSYEDYFKGKRITIMGLAAEGRGLQDAEFALKYGALVTVTDMKQAEELSVALERLEGYSDVTYTLGEHKLEDFTTTDLVIRSASTPLDSPYLLAAREAGVLIHTDESLFFELARTTGLSFTTIGVTGTRGKSTVTQMIYELLKTKLPNVKLGGNLRGLAMLPLLETAQDGDTLVLELDSWKLQGLGGHAWSPHIAVFTTFMNDHMNYYKGDMARYLQDKAQIFLHQSSDDYLIAGQQVATLLEAEYGPDIISQVIIPEADLPGDWEVGVPGDHNRYNASLALEVAFLLEVEEEEAKEVLLNFHGLPGRLEYLGEKEGVKYYNDNNSTTPDATIAAVKAFPDYQGKIILIGGGTDKELDYREYAQVIPEYVREMVLFTGTATEKIKMVLPNRVSVVEVASMEEAVRETKSKVQPGDIVLFSPGAASFGIFKNEYDRGDQFVEAIKKL